MSVTAAVIFYAFSPWPGVVGRGACRTLALSHDGATLAAGYNDGTLVFWSDARPNGTTGDDPDFWLGASEAKKQAIAEKASKWPILSIAASPAEEVFASGGEDGDIYFSSRGNGLSKAALQWSSRNLFRPHLPSGVTALVFSPDGNELIPATEDGSLWLPDTLQGKFARLEIATNLGVVHSLEFALTGRVLVSAGEDGMIRFWDTNSFAPYGTPLFIGSPIRSMAVYPHQLPPEMLRGMVVATAPGKTPPR